MEVKIHERTDCEMAFTSEQLFAMLRKAGYAIPETEDNNRVQVYVSKPQSGGYRIRLKWVKVVLVDPKPSGTFSL